MVANRKKLTIQLGLSSSKLRPFHRVRIDSMAFPHQANEQNSKTQAGNNYFVFIAND